MVATYFPMIESKNVFRSAPASSIASAASDHQKQRSLVLFFLLNMSTAGQAVTEPRARTPEGREVSQRSLDRCSVVRPVSCLVPREHG